MADYSRQPSERPLRGHVNVLEQHAAPSASTGVAAVKELKSRAKVPGIRFASSGLRRLVLRQQLDAHRTMSLTQINLSAALLSTLHARAHHLAASDHEQA
jgi:hypothetical protein